ncbi:xanthine dehydrogenase family protein subunit M [Amorphus sp. 3PC139-8]|uniref:FAD binding domain-containing protein n=1 Tax=Amorphus sp. 3PC139-8 TaxID=2735676 RepID=UPI00345CFBC8
MIDFHYERATNLDEASVLANFADTMVIAGGTTLVDLAKLDVVRPETVVDISRIPGLDAIDVDASGAMIGALAKMSRVADDPRIKDGFPAVAQSLSLAASQQLRNMATIGGNLMQRTRCSYFRDPAAYPSCNKRTPGSGCAALGGLTRNHAVLGTSEACIATYPGDLAVALVALDATLHVGRRTVAAEDFFLLPGETPERETDLRQGEIITAVSVPASPVARRSTYLKVRDRQSYEFASASAAVGLELADDGGTIADLRVALGGVATKPWRARAVEDALRGTPLDEEAVGEASRLAVAEAVAFDGNAYKIELVPRVIARAILTLGGLA